MKLGKTMRQRVAMSLRGKCTALAVIAVAAAVLCYTNTAMANGPSCPSPAPNGCGSAQGQPCKTAGGQAGVCQTAGQPGALQCDCNPAPPPCPPAGPCPPPAPCPASCSSTGGCNVVTSQTVLPPDQPATVYVNLITSCGGAIIRQCHPSFPIAGFLTLDQKCCALVNAITNDPGCQAAGYCVTVNECATLQTFQVADQCPGAVLSMGISNNPGIFSQEGNGPIPDYEAELITPGCTDPDGTAGNSDDIVSQVTLGGTSNGQPIHPGEGPHVEIVTRRGTVDFTAEIPTPAGMPASAIAQALAQQLNAQGIHTGVVNGRSLQIKQPNGGPLVGIPISVGVGTSDNGITTDMTVAPQSLLPAIVAPSLSEWGIMLSVALILAMGFWIMMRRRRTVLA